MPSSVRYSFSQCFAVPANDAYAWCVDYDSGDLALAGVHGAERRIAWLTYSTAILTDIFSTNEGEVEKQKLVQLYPDQLFWVSTHLTGPNKYSQFLYKISAIDDDASRLDFTALHLDYTKENLDGASAVLIAEKLCEADSKNWQLFAKAMEKDLGKKY